VRLVASGPSHSPNNRDDGGELAAITAITEAVAACTEEDSSVEEQQGQEKEEQEREGTNNDGGTFPSSGQPKAPNLESSLISARRSQEVVQGHCTRTQTASPIMLPAREVACKGSRSCIGIQDITFLQVGRSTKGRRRP
jgi:hypothetical protein